MEIQLVVDHIAIRSGSGVGVAVCDIVGAIVLASIVLILPQGFFQGGNSGEVLRGYRVTSYIQRAPPSVALLPSTEVMGRETKKGAVVSMTISGTLVSTTRYRPRGRPSAAVWP